MQEDLTIFPITPEIELFLESCLWEKGIKDLPLEMKKQMVDALYLRLQQWIMAEVVGALTEAQVIDLEKISETETDATKVSNFIRTHIKDVDNFFAASMLKFKEAFVKG